jgi:acetylornithine deacetylase/succinyl-diaminopimelate desuccinylase-like protein
MDSNVHSGVELAVGAFPPVLAKLAASAEVKYALRWFRDREPLFSAWQTEIARIPAPPFGESIRAQQVRRMFQEIGLQDVHCDEVGNVVGVSPAVGPQYVSVSAHMDTVFPADTALDIHREGSRLSGPGISDNAAGLVALLATAGALRECRIHHTLPVVFIANVGEEGEGDLRGIRHIFSSQRWKDAIAYSLVLDGAGCDTVVAQALGSRRFEVTLRGPGGHSWSDFGAPNPIVVMSQVVVELAGLPLPQEPRTTVNVGVIHGGTSVNSIPETAHMRVDIRSVSDAQLDRLEADLHRLVSQAAGSLLSYEMVNIGDRPAAELAPNARILQAVGEVDAFLGNSARLQRASTDANIPISMGREAIAIGGGGTGGGAHTLQEWFDCKGRDLGLKRILLTLLLLANAGI